MKKVASILFMYSFMISLSGCENPEEATPPVPAQKKSSQTRACIEKVVGPKKSRVAFPREAVRAFAQAADQCSATEAELVDFAKTLKPDGAQK